VPKSNAVLRIEKHLELDQRTGVLDVHVLDVLAQVEALLRGAREIQRQILRVPGVPRPPSATQRRAAVVRPYGTETVCGNRLHLASARAALASNQARQARRCRVAVSRCAWRGRSPASTRRSLR
jgi:hypothetical protein